MLLVGLLMLYLLLMSNRFFFDLVKEWVGERESENYLCQVLDRRSSSSLTSVFLAFISLYMHRQIMRMLLNRSKSNMLIWRRRTKTAIRDNRISGTLLSLSPSLSVGINRLEKFHSSSIWWFEEIKEKKKGKVDIDFSLSLVFFCSWCLIGVNCICSIHWEQKSIGKCCCCQREKEE